LPRKMRTCLGALFLWAESWGERDDPYVSMMGEAS